MNNIAFVEELKLLLDKYNISIVRNEDGCFWIDKNGEPILFASNTVRR